MLLAGVIVTTYTHTHTLAHQLVDSKMLLPLPATPCHWSSCQCANVNSVVQSRANLIMTSLLADATSSTRCRGGRCWSIAACGSAPSGRAKCTGMQFVREQQTEQQNKCKHKHHSMLHLNGEKCFWCNVSLVVYTHTYLQAPMMPQVVLIV